MRGKPRFFEVIYGHKNLGSFGMQSSRNSFRFQIVRDGVGTEKQMSDQGNHNPLVGGSNPSAATKIILGITQ